MKKHLYLGLILIFIVFVLNVMGSGSDTASAINQGIDYIKLNNFNGAQSEFAQAVKDDPSNIYANSLSEMINSYIEGKAEYNNKSVTKAIDTLKNINPIYTSFNNIQTDVNTMISNLENDQTKSNQIISQISQLNSLFNEGAYQQANELINQLKKEPLLESQKEIIYNIQLQINSKFQQSGILPNGTVSNGTMTSTSTAGLQSGTTPLNSSSKQTYLMQINKLKTQADATVAKEGVATPKNIQSQQSLNDQWDSLMQEIMAQIKETLPAGQANQVIANQNKWLQTRSKKIATSSTDFSNANKNINQNKLETEQIYQNMTENRCYELVNNYMN